MQLNGGTIKQEEFTTMASLLKRLIWFFRAALRLLDVRLSSCALCGQPTGDDDGCEIRLNDAWRFCCGDCASDYEAERYRRMTLRYYEDEELQAAFLGVEARAIDEYAQGVGFLKFPQ